MTPDEIGMAMQNCGAIEFLVNQLIRKHTTDALLVNTVLRTSLPARADLLCLLLKRQNPALEKSVLDNLRQSIKSVAERRNIIAHNPLMTRMEDKTDLHVVYWKKDTLNEFRDADIRRLIEDSLAVLEMLHHYMPEVS